MAILQYIILFCFVMAISTLFDMVSRLDSVSNMVLWAGLRIESVATRLGLDDAVNREWNESHSMFSLEVAVV